VSLRFLFPELYELVVAADDEQRRSATRVACEVARRRTGLDGPEIDRAAAALEAGRYGETDERRDVRELASRLSNAADGDPQLERQATAARAYSFALLLQSKRAADDGIFLAMSAAGDDLEPAVRALLSDDLAVQPD
jgi:hypothetical protein